MNPAQHAVTWIKVEKPTFDLVGVVLGSFQITGMLLLVALGLGVLLGWSLILSRRRSPASLLHSVSLRVFEP